MTNKTKIPYAKLLELSEGNIIDLHMIDIWINREQLYQQFDSYVGLEANNTISVSSEKSEEITSEEKPSSVFRVHWEKVAKVFACGYSSLTRGRVPGIKYVGASPLQPTKMAMCEVNLNHPKLINMGLTKSHFTKGQKMFYTSQEAMKLFGFTTPNSVSRLFGEPELVRIGKDRRFPVNITNIKIEERRRVEEAHYESQQLPLNIKFPIEVVNEN